MLELLYQLTTGEVVVPAVLNSLVQRFFPPVMSKVKMKKKIEIDTTNKCLEQMKMRLQGQH